MTTTKSSLWLWGAAASLALSVSGCAARTSAPPRTSTPVYAAPPMSMTGTPTMTQAPMRDLASLPAAPWMGQPVGATGAPAPLVRSWRGAQNRAWCAPLAPTDLGAGEGARARSGAVEGGWSVEFDRAGAPGLRPDGRVCAHCGRGAFGVAGTAMTPEQTGPDQVPPPSFSDGSRAWMEPAPGAGEAAAATLMVSGQGCVYQVWSFLGEGHVRHLVEALRFVDLGAGRTVAQASR